MTCWPNWRRRMPPRAEFGIRANDAEDVAVFRIGIHAEEQIRRGKIEEAERVRLDDLREIQDAAQFRGGGRNTHGEQGVARLGGGEQMADGADAADARHQMGIS